MPLPALLAEHAGQEPLPNQPGQVEGIPVTICAVLTRTAVIEGPYPERRLVRLAQIYVDPESFGSTPISGERKALEAARDRGRRASARSTFNREAPPSHRSA